MDATKAIYITDLSRCQPAAALSAEHRKYRWQTVPYEAEGVSGVLLFAGPETEAPPVTLPLGVSGWHAVFVGLWSNWTPSSVKMKLTGDPAYIRMEREEADSFVVDERFWRYADLTGQDIVFAQQSTGFSAPAYVACVKLVPLSEGEAADLRSDRTRTDTKRLIFMNDGFSDFHRFRPTTAEEIWEWLEPYRDTDCKMLFWCIGAGGDMLTYPSKIGKLMGTDVADFPRMGDRQLAESMQILVGEGIDPVRTVVEFAHSMRIEVHLSQRMEAFQCCPPFEEFFTGDFYRTHPECRCVDRDGREIARLSYAFPEVRELVLSIFRELATEYDIDGVHPIFNRGAPFVLYEQPLVEGFQKGTGLDPRQLDERDEQYLGYRAGVMTGFMRTLRQQMNEIGAKRGRKVEISAHVLNNGETNLFYGLDVPVWVKEGLIDHLISYPWRNEEIDVDYFARLTQGAAVKYYPEVMPRRMSPEAYRQRALRYYATGADGLCFWDTDGRDPYKRAWSMLRRLGHREELAHWDDGEGTFFRSIKLRSVGGYVVDKYPPHWAY